MKLTVNATVPYDILIENGLLKHCADCFLHGKILVVTDDGVPSLYLDTLLLQLPNAKTMILPHGEKQKSVETLQKLWSYLAENHFTRQDAIIALGGGVVGDVSGFASATYMRGIAFYQIPTTLLSMVDSSVGGKNAIDYMGYKNIVGSFYSPKKVLIDPTLISTLDDRNYACGMAEIIKIATTCDADFFAHLEKQDISPEEMIFRAVSLKKEIVEQDEREKNLRMVLNFGHTLGHILELQNGMNDRHGECVSVGMLPFCSDGVYDRLCRLLCAYHLPTEADLTKEVLQSGWEHDKKTDGAEITEIFVDAVGTYAFRKMNFDQWADCVLKRYGGGK